VKTKNTKSFVGTKILYTFYKNLEILVLDIPQVDVDELHILKSGNSAEKQFTSEVLGCKLIENINFIDFLINSRPKTVFNPFDDFLIYFNIFFTQKMDTYRDSSVH
jgi:hypothetical protein